MEDGERGVWDVFNLNDLNKISRLRGMHNIFIKVSQVVIVAQTDIRISDRLLTAMDKQHKTLMENPLSSSPGNTLNKICNHHVCITKKQVHYLR